MAGSTAINIVREWATRLVGLRMKVEERWWQGCKGTKLYTGKLTGIDFGKEKENYVILELNDEPGDPYHMRYDAVLKYADYEDHNFHKFHLPPGQLQDPSQEEVTVTRQRAAWCAGRRTGTRQGTNRESSRIDRVPNVDPTENGNQVSADVKDAENESSDSGTNTSNTTVFKRTDPEDWQKIGGRTKGHRIEPVLYTGEHEEFKVNMTEEEFKSVCDSEGHVRYEKVFEWMLPTFGKIDEISFFDFMAARMRNYMVWIMRKKG